MSNANQTIPLSTSYLLDICDYRANYLGCDAERTQMFATIDLIMIIMAVGSIFGYLGILIRNFIARAVNDNKKKWNSADNLCIFCCLANVLRIAELANVRSVAFKDKSLLTDLWIQQYLQITVLMDLLYYSMGAVASSVFMVGVAGAATGLNIYSDIKIGERVISPEKILKLWRIVIMIISLSFTICWATIGATKGPEEYAKYRRGIYGLNMAAIVFIALPVILYFGNNVLRILSETNSSRDMSEGTSQTNVQHSDVNSKHKSKVPESVSKHNLAGELNRENRESKTPSYFKRTEVTPSPSASDLKKLQTKKIKISAKDRKIGNFRMAINTVIWLLYVAVVFNHILLFMGFEMDYFLNNTTAAAILKTISDLTVWVSCSFMLIYLYRVG
ncbi:hypothetical protein HK103_006109 [Boothiomyces macroporosus]|uniref:Uncharacterized protein n=1 Tax=Boothiomyces macroporosus TaxID=261099 RepID=A0AAD5Y701_9FUNG|nr:hypothetical protein HK103_006109 [Boothiomyces macroporosus]